MSMPLTKNTLHFMQIDIVMIVIVMMMSMGMLIL